MINFIIVKLIIKLSYFVNLISSIVIMEIQIMFVLIIINLQNFA